MTVKKGSSTAKVASSADTTLWEQLLSRRGGTQPTATTTGAAGAASSRPAVPETAVKAAPRSDKLPKKKRKAVASADTKGVGNLHKSNWATLAAGGGATASVSNGHPTTDKSKKKRAKQQQGSKRPRAEMGSSNSNSMATTTTPNFFSVSRNTTVSGASSTAGVSGKAGKKRKRTAGAGGIGSPAESTNGSAPNHVTGGKQGGRPGANNSTKWPRSNVLNLAFQAQKEEAAAAAATVAAGGAKHNGGGKGRGKRGGSEQALTAAEKAQYVSLDCEMVGVGPGGCRSALARCCLVDWDGNTIYDKHVTPNERVTDFRTFVSGVKANHLKGGLRLRQCQEEVAAILKDKVLIGHALTNDLKAWIDALMMSHPPRSTRDTATYRPYQKAHGKAGGKLRPRSLKLLSQEHLDRPIQTGQHNPAEDAKAAMDLYKIARFEWEKSLSAAGKMRGRKGFVDQQGP
ncbi:unnamed protein product [Ectocarpus fasciculatus]